MTLFVGAGGPPDYPPMSRETLHRYCWALVMQLDQRKVEAAAACLRKHFEAAQGHYADITHRIQENRTGWLTGRPGEFAMHFGWGMAVRNLLRSRGYGEKYLGIENLDDYYVPLVELACGFTNPYDPEC